ncbi:sialate O-acetylesterase [Sphingomonas sp. BGYR3]|uniref:sialate O-acetylesterase n=1 Tax=Sphingomonas sp. BGYR3 TaxID=2975483 RepID=UPI0021A49B97|nr:sialate O-acetylesterase [Sphingomonas sp. BGYR3]MDG5487460.1 sialate O-acetylesterase [Sphingomonas sp. BGYR3]
MIHRTFAAALLLAAGAAQAEPVILTPMSSHAVIQRDRPVIVTGTADPGEALTIAMGSAAAKATADAKGRWQAMLPPIKAGGEPLTLTVTGAGGKTATMTDLLVGDVWLCSGQSNMEYQTRNALNGPALVASSADPQIRLLQMERRVAYAPDAPLDKRPSWAAASPDSVGGFSAACYLMVKQLKAEQGVPMGAIDASWGGTAIRPWIPLTDARPLPGNAEDAALLDQYAADPAKALATYAGRWGTWWRKETGDKPGQEPWNAPQRLNWQPVPKMTPWEQWGGATAELNGTVWFARDVSLDKAATGKAATLSLAGIDELDTVWINGVPVGSSFGWGSWRTYPVPAGVLKPGQNRILVAIGDTWGPGGFMGPVEQMKLTVEGQAAVPLSDGWRYSVSTVKGMPPRTPWESHWGLSTLYNGMIAPLGPIALKGAAWYQGESDVGTRGYDKRMAALMAGWRRQSGVADLPFLIVGLTNYGAPTWQPVDSAWAATRNEQRLAAVNDPRAAIVTAIDIGERTDIHPANKNELALRLARAATALAYGGAKSPSGPLVSGARREGNDVVVSFSGVTGSLRAWSAPQPIGFELCGAGAGCRYAVAQADGATVRLTGDGKPVDSVRYAWADAPVVNLFDEAPLPAVPFEVAVQ